MKRYHIISLLLSTMIFIMLSPAAWSKRIAKYQYQFIEKERSTSETVQLVGGVYLASWVTYYATQPDTFREEGSFTNYWDNLGEVVFDKDEPFWNWLVHPYSGSQLYLLYRAYGYNEIDSVKLAFVSSTLFEFFVEVYTEPASFQDLYQTPILGSMLGLGLEKLSFYLLNTGNPAAEVLGHILNPATLLWFYEGKVQITPVISKNKAGFVLGATF